MKLNLLSIPGLKLSDQSVTRVYALSIDDRSLVLTALADWEKNQVEAYRCVMKVFRFVGAYERVANPKHVKRGEVYPETYEVRADYRRSARVLFFYDGANAICTNTFWKGEGSQTAAFETCDNFRKFYFANKPKFTVEKK